MAITHLPIFRNFPTWQKLINANLDYLLSISGGGGGVTDGDKGDIVVSGSGATWTIDTAAVTLAKMENRGTQTFIGRNTAGTGVPEEIAAATAKTMLNLSGTNTGDQTITLTGDVTGSGTGTFATTLSSALTPRKAQATVDFGASTQETETATVSVAAAWVTASSYIVCAPAAVATAEHDADDYSVEGITASVTNISAGVGFDIVARAAERTFGTYLINAVGLA